MTGTWGGADVRQESSKQVSLWRQPGADLWTFQRHQELWRGGRSCLKTAASGLEERGWSLLDTRAWRQTRCWRSSSDPEDIFLTSCFLSALWCQGGKKRRKKREGGMTHLSILHQLLKFLQKGCTALKRVWIFSNKGSFDFSLAFRLVSGRNKPSCLQVCVLSKCFSFNTRAEMQCRSDTFSCLPMAWSDCVLCSLRQILFSGGGLKVLLTLEAVRAGVLWTTGLAALTKCWNLSPVGR